MKLGQIIVLIWSFFRRNSIAGVAEITRNLLGTHGLMGTLGLILRRLKLAGAPARSSPIARLVATDTRSGRSLACFADVALIASLDLPQCRKYRVLQRQEMIERFARKRLTTTHYHDYYRWRTLLQSAGKVMLYRVPAGALFDGIMTEARRLGLPVGYDIDDAVFDLDTVKSNPNLPYLSRQIRHSLFRDAAAFTIAMRQCDFITVSTPGLRRLVSKRFPEIPCYVIPNGVDTETIHYGAVAREQLAARPSETFRIILTSGSLAHAADTEAAADGIRQFLERRPAAELVSIGHFHAGDALRGHKALKEFPFLPYSEYLRLLATADCALVPLAGGVFNEGKSIVRLIDATEVGVPVIASPVGEYAEPELCSTFISAHSSADWCTRLEEIAASYEWSSKFVDSAQKRVREPRLLRVLWENLEAPLHAFFGSSRAQARLPVAESALSQ